MPDSKPEAVSATALIDALIDARIDAQIASLQDWRGPRLASIRQWIKAADPGVIEEWKWRGVPVWSGRTTTSFAQSRLQGPVRCTGNARKAVATQAGHGL